MRRREMRYLHGCGRRSAFTLMELMVVIFIIVTLMALSAGAVIKFMAVQQRSNTQTTLDRTQAKVNKAWSAVKDQAFMEPIPAITQSLILQPAPPWPGLAGNDTLATDRMRVIYVKLRMRQVFPMNFCEALNVPYYSQSLGMLVPSSPVPALTTYQTYLNNLGINQAYLTSLGCTSPTYQPQPYESSACLLMALQRMQSGTGVDASDLISGGATGHADTPTGGGIPYLTDAWAQPIRFARHPTGSILLNPNGAQPGNNDLGDPQGYLSSGTWAYGNNQACRNVFFSLVLQQPARQNVPTLSFKLAPMLVSAGPDRNLTTDPVTFAQQTTDSDDLFSTP